jgi:D-3-phosphoglycerate dehydrogenase
MADILISENIAGTPIDELRRTHDVSFLPDIWKDPVALREAVRGSRALVVRNQTQVTAELIAAAERLEIVARAGVGLDNVDVRAASRAGVVVALTPSQNAISVAELTIGLVLALARKIPAADRHAKQGGWARHQFMGSELFGKTLGVVGFGRIGYLTARRAAAFGMDILAHDPYLDPDAMTVAEVRPRLTSLDELLAVADVVSCHLPANDETRGLFNYDCFCRMKPTALFVNVARGEVVDEDGLVRALGEGKIAGAALDVRKKEPPQVGPLCQMDNVILTPHIAGFTHEAQHRVVAALSRDVGAVLAGGPATYYANFPRPRRNGGRS